MSQVRISVWPTKLVDVHVDDQHLFRLREEEVREIVLQLIVFCGPELRNEVKGWLNGEEFNKMADYITPIKEPQS